MSRKASIRLRTAVALFACLAVAGTLATTGFADPVARSAAAATSSVKKALRLGNSANRKASRALALAKDAQKDAAAAKGQVGPAGPAGPIGERGAQGANGTNGVNGVNGTNGTNGAAGATGATGATGTAGATGATGPSGSVGLWAVIEASSTGATVVRGSAGITATRLGNGVFDVDFGANVTGCAYLATIGSIADETAIPGFVTVEQRTSQPEEVVLRAWKRDTGALEDPGTGYGFHVAAIC
jgi:hypothetical protein